MREPTRVVIWFSCGAASAVAAKLALEQYADSGLEIAVCYCDTGSEHPDNARFLSDCERWFDHSITVLRNPDYADTWAVWNKRRYIAGIAGAPCTLELKKAVRERFERPDIDLQVFGFDVTEMARADLFRKNQPEVRMVCPLIDQRITKAQCFLMLQEAGIALPAMYMLGYRNNNCIGCPKGNAGYWNKIRRDFPEVFARMAALERELGAKICQATINGERRRVHLDELPESAGRYSDEPPITCGLLCTPVAA
jgi:3'-phosphoadenosine 5'-phosphosulfate sulfotransferase (PAPS reductase)/FAD synthetase